MLPTNYYFDASAFKKNLKETRKGVRNGMPKKAPAYTQEEVAEYLGISRNAYQKYECISSKTLPDIAVIPDLAKIFEVSIEYLFTGSDSE